MFKRCKKNPNPSGLNITATANVDLDISGQKDLHQENTHTKSKNQMILWRVVISLINFNCVKVNSGKPVSVMFGSMC